jgi:aldehyde dehydrogenase (NAD+)
MSEVKRWQNYIDGRWVDAANGETIEIEDPATGLVFAEAPRGQQEDINRAVEAARAAVKTRALYEMNPHDRGTLLYRIGAELRAMRDQIVPVIVRENGKNTDLANDEVDDAARYFEYYGGLTGKLFGKSIPLGDGFVNYSQLVPYGVTAHIIPWNFPLELAGRDIAPALACGNSVVVKSPELCPLMLTFLAIAAERAGLPRGYLNIVCGYGAEAGEALASHDGIDHVTFTGSVATGRRVGENAARNIIPALLELGGKGAGIVYADADLEKVAQSAGVGIFAFSGQICSAGSRLIVPRALQEQLVERIVGWVGDRTLGAGIDGHFFTPLISERQRRNAETACNIAKQEGAEIVLGGKRPDREGFFLEPTILINVTPNQTACQKEIFGPVLSIITYEEPEEAIEIANATDYGLTAGVYTKDLRNAHWTADRLEAGTVYVNKWFAGGMETPFGGMKRSGYGRVKGAEGLGNYAQIRNIAIKLQ